MDIDIFVKNRKNVITAKGHLKALGHKLKKEDLENLTLIGHTKGKYSRRNRRKTDDFQQMNDITRNTNKKETHIEICIRTRAEAVENDDRPYAKSGILKICSAQ